jgi:hypothetical protein
MKTVVDRLPSRKRELLFQKLSLASVLLSYIGMIKKILCFVVKEWIFAFDCLLQLVETCVILWTVNM